jgi:UDPglucose 6-dehydrogenase
LAFAILNPSMRFVYLKKVSHRDKEMRIGFIGTGKLGLPVSLLYSSKGHDVLCYDVNPAFYNGTSAIDLLYNEELCPKNQRSLKDWFQENPLQSQYSHTQNVEDIVKFADLIFVAVQTPHDPRFEGTDRLLPERADFDYTYLQEAMKTISKAADACNKDIIVSVISTVLPGTMRREIFPFLSSRVKLCYNPYFIAMGTVANDCLYPEFILLGNRDLEATNVVVDFYKTITDSPVYTTTIENAEMIKVSYNTFIGTKIAMANTIMELCNSLPNTNCDDVMNALFLADKRLISKTYLRGGMGDGGGCHPRDNIALSWLSNKVGVQFNWYDAIMTAREKQTDFLANCIETQWKETSLPVILLGKSFKANTAITTGSPAVLLGNILTEKGIPFRFHDPYIEEIQDTSFVRGIYFVSCAHDSFLSYKLPPGSVLLDPHRKYSACIQDGTYIPIGVGK